MGDLHEAASELHNSSGLPIQDCKSPVAQNVGDVDATLRSLIASGRIDADDLDPDIVSDELFYFAVLQEKIRYFREIQERDTHLAAFGKKHGMTPDETPEELAIKVEAQRAKQCEQRRLAGRHFITSAMQARERSRTKRRTAYLEANPKTLALAPFPALKMELSDWEGLDILPSWAGTQARHGGYTSTSSDEPSDGTVAVKIPRRCINDANPLLPSPEQIAAYAYLKENEAVITASVFDLIRVTSFATMSNERLLKHKWREPIETN